MRRQNMGNKVVKRAITWAMVLMLSFSAGMSSIGTMTVYAVDNRVDDCDLEKERVDSDAEQFNNKETSQDPAAEAALSKAEDCLLYTSVLRISSSVTRRECCRKL